MAIQLIAAKARIRYLIVLSYWRRSSITMADRRRSAELHLGQCERERGRRAERLSAYRTRRNRRPPALAPAGRSKRGLLLCLRERAAMPREIVHHLFQRVLILDC